MVEDYGGWVVLWAGVAAVLWLIWLSIKNSNKTLATFRLVSPLIVVCLGGFLWARFWPHTVQPGATEHSSTFVSFLAVLVGMVVGGLALITDAARYESRRNGGDRAPTDTPTTGPHN